MSTLRVDTLVHTRYRVVQLLGQGGFGAVYEAIDERLGRRVALKQLLRVGDRISRQFEREARLLANLSHPALPRVTDHFTDQSGQFLVMDYIPGNDLMELLIQQDRPFPVDQVLRWGLMLLDALHYLHTRQPPIIHRDIKPQNLKLQADGSIILLDFGLAKGFAGDVAPPTTESSFLAYTKGYAPPEQIENTGTDERSDLYSLGGTLHCLLTNTAPPEAQTRLLAAARQRPDPLRGAHELNPQVPEAVSRVLLHALALEPSERPASAQQLRNLLEAATRTGSTPVVRPVAAEVTELDTTPIDVGMPRVPAPSTAPLPRAEAPTIAAQPPRRSMQWIWPAVGGAAIVLAVLIVLASRVTDGAAGTSGSSNGATRVSADTSPMPPAATDPSALTRAATAEPSAIPATAVPTPVIPTAEPPTPAQSQVINLSTLATTRASSVLPPEQTQRFGLVQFEPSNVLDGNPATSWVEGQPGSGIGERLELFFPHTIMVKRLGITIGFDRDADIFAANNRVRRARLIFSDGSEQSFEFADQRGLQFVPITDISTTHIAIQIEEVYPGSAYDDTAIAEVAVWGYAIP